MHRSTGLFVSSRNRVKQQSGYKPELRKELGTSWEQALIKGHHSGKCCGWHDWQWVSLRLADAPHPLPTCRKHLQDDQVKFRLKPNVFSPIVRIVRCVMTQVRVGKLIHCRLLAQSFGIYNTGTCTCMCLHMHVFAHAHTPHTLLNFLPLSAITPATVATCLSLSLLSLQAWSYPVNCSYISPCLYTIILTTSSLCGQLHS